MPPQPDAYRILTIRLPEPMHRALKVRAAQEGWTMQGMVYRLLQDALAPRMHAVIDTTK